MTDINAVDRVGRDLVVTVATHDEGYISFFRESCARYNIDPIFLGQGAKWEGFGTKFRLMMEWIHTLHDNDLVLTVDCYDVIFLRSVDTLFRKFEENAKKSGNDPFKYMYCSNEPHMWPISYVTEMNYGVYNGFVLNSGSFIAYGKLLKEIFSNEVLHHALYTKSLCDDQQLLTSYLLAHPDVKCEMDENRRFILYAPFRVDVGSRIMIDAKGSLTYRGNAKQFKPYLLHRNGNGYMTNILQKLGYNVDGIDTKSNHVQRFVTCHIPHFFNRVFEAFVPSNKSS